MSYKVVRDHREAGFAVSSGDGTSFFHAGTIEQAEAKCNYLNGGDGLTRRERFAMAAMQGILAADADFCVPPGMVAEWSVQRADVLIAELEKQK